MEKSDEQYKRLCKYVQNTHAATHQQYALEVLDVRLWSCYVYVLSEEWVELSKALAYFVSLCFIASVSTFSSSVLLLSLIHISEPTRQS